jgi:hypothetical protein
VELRRFLRLQKMSTVVLRPADGRRHHLGRLPHCGA